MPEENIKWHKIGNIKGEPGKGLTILGYYATPTELANSITNPSAGDAYSVGSAAPYQIYVYSANQGWVNNGALQGAKGEDGLSATITAVTAEVDQTIGEPSVAVTLGGTERERSFHFAFSGLKGEPGNSIEPVNYINSDGIDESFDINEQSPTYTESQTLETLTSGETLSIAFGKIKKAITDLISHIANKSNPHNITASQIGAADSSHSHTANSLLVKSIGGGTVIKDNDDLNSFTTAGNYMCSLTATALTLQNCPARGAFVMTVGYATGTPTYLYQEVTHFSTGVKYYRTYTASTNEWSDWRTTYSTSNKPTSDDIGALSKTGGTLTGSLEFENLSSFHVLKKGRNIGTVEHELSLGVSSNGASTIEHYTAGVLDGRLELMNVAGNTAALVLRENSEGTQKAIFGEHNATALGIPKIKVGSYVGTGTYVSGQETPSAIEAAQNKLVFPAFPRIVFIKKESYENFNAIIMPNPDTKEVDFRTFGDNKSYQGRCTGQVHDDFSLTWYALTQRWKQTANLTTGDVSVQLESLASDQYHLKQYGQLNEEGVKYQYVAVCL